MIKLKINTWTGGGGGKESEKKNEKTKHITYIIFLVFLLLSLSQLLTLRYTSIQTKIKKKRIWDIKQYFFFSITTYSFCVVAYLFLIAIFHLSTFAILKKWIKKKKKRKMFLQTFTKFSEKFFYFHFAESAFYKFLPWTMDFLTFSLQNRFFLVLFFF